MITINRTINGNNFEFQLTEAEIEEVRKQDKIQWAKDILPNYEEMIINYDRIMSDDKSLLKFAELLEDKNLEDNGDREIKAIEELFETEF